MLHFQPCSSLYTAQQMKIILETLLVATKVQKNFVKNITPAKVEEAMCCTSYCEFTPDSISGTQ